MPLLMGKSQLPIHSVLKQYPCLQYEPSTLALKIIYKPFYCSRTIIQAIHGWLNISPVSPLTKLKQKEASLLSGVYSASFAAIRSLRSQRSWYTILRHCQAINRGTLFIRHCELFRVKQSIFDLTAPTYSHP